MQTEEKTTTGVMNVLCMHFDIYNNILGYMGLLLVVVYLAKKVSKCLTNRGGYWGPLLYLPSALA